jgi:hypothetical protein
MIAARSRLIPVLLAVLAGPLSAQGSPNVPLDDPRLPLIEYLIMRGSIQDPSPMHRPFRRADLVASMERADSTPRTGMRWARAAASRRPRAIGAT